jgi:hypothetical protein
MLHYMNDSLILSIVGLCFILLCLWYKQREIHAINAITTCLKTRGIDQATGSQGQSRHHTYQELLGITTLAGLDDWTNQYDPAIGHHSVRGKDDNLVCHVISRDHVEQPYARLSYAATFKYIATFNPRLMVQLLHKLQTYELIIRTVEQILPEHSPCRKIIALGESYQPTLLELNTETSQG